ncbi:MAG: lysophospholipase L1-like esterase [Gammaproteobacteria bacterium]|jgi:lysophospholipase L1-like esterase|tara:strand:+ start:282 stop:1211 length:930 start_codon:yes stop_codon:yes gene_type:complete
MSRMMDDGLRTRSGHCIQCHPSKIAYASRNSEAADLYIAGSYTSKVLKRKASSRQAAIKLILIIVVFGFVACGFVRIDDPEIIGGGIKSIKIVALGDSTTEASWDGNAKEVYTSRLQRELEKYGIEAEVINAGISNTDSRQALARLDYDVRRHNPDVVIVQFGINDSWIDASLGRSEPRLTLTEYRACLEKIIDTLKGEGTGVIIMTSNPMRWSELYGEELRDPVLGFDFDDARGLNLLLEVYVEEVRLIAAEKKVPLIDVFKKFEDYDLIENKSIHDLLIPDDEMHPNDLGHQLIAKWLTDLLIAEFY